MKYKASKNLESGKAIIEVEYKGDSNKAFPSITDDHLNQTIKAIRLLISSIDYKINCHENDELYMKSIYSILDEVGLSLCSQRSIFAKPHSLDYVRDILLEAESNKVQDDSEYDGVFTNLDEDEMTDEEFNKLFDE